VNAFREITSQDLGFFFQFLLSFDEKVKEKLGSRVPKKSMKYTIYYDLDII